MPSLHFTIRQLEYFDAVASVGSIAAASERCHVSASALALALDELEDRLSLQLFVRRKGKGVALTAAGTRLLTHARRILSDAETLAADASQASTSLTGRFGIGCFSTLAPFFLPGIMGEFQAGHPGLNVELVEAAAPELHELLLQGRIDAALLYSVDVSPQLAFEPVREYRPYVMVAEDHPFAQRRSAALGELVGEPMILLDVHPTRLNTEHIYATLGLKPRVGHLTTSFELVRCLAARGLGYAVLFQRPASPLTYDGRRLAILEVEDEVPHAVVGLARPAGVPPTVRYAALRDHLASEPANAARAS
jgi:DNA-binding transcriptional LysR family regulator